MRQNDFTIGPNDANVYTVSEGLVDLSRRSDRQPRLCRFAAEPVDIRVDKAKIAIVIVDMQNDFCTEGGMVSERGGNFRILRQPIAPLRTLTGKLTGSIGCR